MGFSQALGKGSLPGKLREQIALTVAGANTCDYCASAHTAIGGQLGIGSPELEANLSGVSTDPKTQAALTFAKTVVEREGFVADEDLAAARAAGYSEGEVVEIFASVVVNIFTNYFNHIAQAEIDFPVVSTAK